MQSFYKPCCSKAKQSEPDQQETHTDNYGHVIAHSYHACNSREDLLQHASGSSGANKKIPLLHETEADAGAGSAIIDAIARDPHQAYAQCDSTRVTDVQDAWSEFRTRAEQRGGVPLAPPVVLKAKSAAGQPKPQLCTGHVPVLLRETLDALLAPGLPGIYVDGTFGRGGHSTQILKRLPPGGRLVAFDVDPSAIAVGKELEKTDSRFQIVHRPFGDIADVLKGEKLAGVMIDIGFSSPQVDEQHRGFSVVEDGPLDLRMNPDAGQPCSEWLRTATAEEVAWVIREWGEDDDPIMALRIAEGVLDTQRRYGTYKSTLQIAEVIRQVKLGQDDRGQHPAKLPFQAFRVFLNHEMEQLSAFLEGSGPILQIGARMVVITFKRPEAGVVKRFLREHELPIPTLERVLKFQRLAELYPVLNNSDGFAMRQTCPTLVPTAAEVERNRRSRSAMVHVLERVKLICPERGEVSASLPLENYFCRPMSLWSPPGTAPSLALLPPRTSGSLAPALLSQCWFVAGQQADDNS